MAVGALFGRGFAGGELADLFGRGFATSTADPAIATCAAGATGTLLESNDQTTNEYALDADYRYGERFPTNPFTTIYGACFRMRRQGSPTGSVRLVAHSLDGVGALTDDPADYVGDAYDISAVTTDVGGAFYWLPLSANLSSITDLLIAVQVEADAVMDGSNYIALFGDTSSGGYAGGELEAIQLPSTVVGGTSGGDISFRVYGVSGDDDDISRIRDGTYRRRMSWGVA